MPRREEGQILPGLAVLLAVALVLSVIMFQIGKASFERSQAQTAADASALSGVREIQRQLERQWATLGTTDVAAIDRAAVIAAMREYARRNEAELVDEELNLLGADVKAWTRSARPLGKQAERVGRGDFRATARARARVELGPAPEAAGQAGAIGGERAPGGTPRVTAADWQALAKRLGPKPRDCPDVIALGLFLVDHGFMVWQNADPRLGGTAGHEDRPLSHHHDCNDRGALDVNYGGAGDLNPVETAALDPIRAPLEQLGFFTIWRDGGEHDNHMHIDIHSSPASRVGGGFTGPLEDAALAIRLIDWEAPAAAVVPGAFGTTRGLGGPPDPQIMALMCRMAGPYGPKILLATFETAIVESGVHNLSWGDADSHGVFQQQYTQGWGTLADTMNPPRATRMFLDALLPLARAHPGLSAGQLAALVQRPRADLVGRYDAVEGQAAALIREAC